MNIGGRQIQDSHAFQLEEHRMPPLFNRPGRIRPIRW